MLAWVFFLRFGRDDGHTDEAPDDQHRAASFPSGIAAAETSARCTRTAIGRCDRLGHWASPAIAALNQFWADGPGLLFPKLEQWSITAIVETPKIYFKLFGAAGDKYWQMWSGRTSYSYGIRCSSPPRFDRSAVSLA